MRFPRSLAIPIIALLAAVAIGMLLIGYYINMKVFYGALEEREADKAKSIHFSITSIIDEEVDKLTTLSKVLKRNRELSEGLAFFFRSGGDLSRLSPAMDRVLADTRIQILLMTDREGTVVYRANNPAERGDPHNVWGFDEAVRGEDIVAASEGPRGWAIRAIVPVFVNGKVSGTLMLGTRIDDPFAKRIAEETGAQVSFATLHGVLASSLPYGEEDLIDFETLQRSLLERRPIFRIDFKAFRAFRYVPIKVVDETFCVVVDTDVSAVKGLLSENRWKLTQTAALIFLAIVVLGSSLTLYLIRPLKRLQTRALGMIREYSGTEPNVAAAGNEIQTLVHATDVMVETINDHVAERKKAEEALRETSRTLEALIASSPLAIVACEPDGVVKKWNPAAERIFGWSREEVLGRRYPVAAADTNVDFHEVRNRVLAGEAFSNIEISCRQKDGTLVDVAYSAAPLRDGNGNVCGVMAIAADITESKKAEEMLRRSEAQLLQSRKMEAVGRLAGGVAHDFNNLLTAIAGYSDLVLSRLGEDDPNRADVEEIRRAGDRAAALTHQLLAFSRRQVLQPKVLNLNDVAANMNKMLRRVIGETIDLVSLPGPDLGMVKADPNQVEQVILNIAVNARDAMPKGGRLAIATANVERDEPSLREGAFLPAGRYVMLSISDTGCGMDEETKSHIFEPFFTTKEVGKGTGLGLATIYGIVKQSGGYVVVDSRPGEGTTFSIYLPRVDEEAPEALPAPPADVPTAGDETVLVVEDESVVRALVCDILRRNGYSVIEARHGEEAMAVTERRADRIDLLLTDVVMPRMGGRELAARLMPLRPRMRVLFMSGHAEEAIAQFGPLEPGTSFLQKPFSGQVLARKVREVLGPPRQGSSV